MKMLVVSHTPHYRSSGAFVGWGATVREIDQLAREFEEVVHVAPLHAGDAPDSSLPYRARNVRIRPVPFAGGTRLLSKASIIATYPFYARAILDEMAKADVIHVRAPANISLLTIILLSLRPASQRRWIKYAGSWNHYNGEAWTYAFQRWWLQTGLTRAVVTVNGHWHEQQDFVHTLMNPCLTETERKEAGILGSAKVLGNPLRLLFVGQLSVKKGILQTIDVLELVSAEGVPVVLDVVGDGPARDELERRIESASLSNRVTLHGWVPRTRLSQHYGRANILLLPSLTEGWPKVISEAIAFGVVPIASAVGSIPEYLSSFRVGKSLPLDDIRAFANAVVAYHKDPDKWKKESLRGMEETVQFTYEHYKKTVRELLRIADVHV